MGFFAVAQLHRPVGAKLPQRAQQGKNVIDFIFVLLRAIVPGRTLFPGIDFIKGRAEVFQLFPLDELTEGDRIRFFGGLAFFVGKAGTKRADKISHGAAVRPADIVQDIDHRGRIHRKDLIDVQNIVNHLDVDIILKFLAEIAPLQHRLASELVHARSQVMLPAAAVAGVVCDDLQSGQAAAFQFVVGYSFLDHLKLLLVAPQIRNHAAMDALFKIGLATPAEGGHEQFTVVRIQNKGRF